MARGYIYEISDNKDELNNYTEINFYEMLNALSVSYVEDILDDSVRKNFLDCMKQYGAKRIGKNGFILTDAVKENYFANAFATVKNIVENMTLNEFATSDLYSLRTALQDDYDDCVCCTGDALKTFDRWMRDAETNKPYYVGNVIMMHCQGGMIMTLHNKMITNKDDLENFIINEYRKYDTELNSLFFDVEVSMPKQEILEAYASIQRIINGDAVIRLEKPFVDENGLLQGEEADSLIPEGEYEEIYKGNCKDFLESFNGKETDSGFCRYSDDELLDFIW